MTLLNNHKERCVIDEADNSGSDQVLFYPAFVRGGVRLFFPENLLQLIFSIRSVVITNNFYLFGSLIRTDLLSNIRGRIIEDERQQR